MKNIDMYFKINDLKSNMRKLNNKDQQLSNEIKKIRNHICLMNNNNIDLIETKSMWSLGYSPIKSKILLH
ncbi:hypothetical protein FZC35_01435 [Candidatus Cytomitobacter indipagum]|uniref:Uncharacterized protein n=2 Tax=Candidatus Cytomitobacter indipagum TaxID=2601575 RepID=A0A5C0UG66_9PROT|nr:hypothetical protein FZC35_01435 [Candidatus Cytomitobacter indipagum]